VKFDRSVLDDIVQYSRYASGLGRVPAESEHDPQGVQDVRFTDPILLTAVRLHRECDSVLKRWHRRSPWHEAVRARVSWTTEIRLDHLELLKRGAKVVGDLCSDFIRLG